jgi:hypothetical protein
MIKRLLFFFFSKKLDKINKLQDKNKNEECYIIGGGASLKWFNLEKFTDKKSIVINYVPFHNNFNILNCDYCILSEPFWFLPLEKVEKSTAKKSKNILSYLRIIPNPTQAYYKKFMKKYKQKYFFINLSNFFTTNYKNVFYLFKKVPKSSVFQDFLDNGLNPFQGSFQTAVFLAIHLGFKKVYLVGFDYTHTPSRIGHWFEKGEGKLIDIKNYNEKFLNFISKYIEIETVTIDESQSKLKSISYKKLTGENPVYKENYEIVSGEALKILSSFPVFEIY